MSPGRFVALVALAATFAHPAGAIQQSAPKKRATPAASRDATALRAEQQHAWGLVESLAEHVDTVPDEATRIRIKARIADLLWERDPARARRLFREAFDDSDDLSDDARRLFGGPGRLAVRAEIIQRVYRRDPILAARMAEELDDGATDPVDGASLLDSSAERSEVLVQVAIGLAASDPAAAADLGRRSLADGIARGLPSLLAALAQSDRAAADALAVEAIDSVDMADPLALRLVFVGSYAIPDLFPQGLGVSAPHATNPVLAARFLRRAFEIAERLSQVAVERSPEIESADQVVARHELAFGYLILSALLPAYDRYLPDVADEVRALTGRVGTGLDATVRDAADDFLAPSADTPEAFVRRAESAGTPAQREQLLITAARMAMARGADYDDVKAIVFKLDAESPSRAALHAEAASRAARRLGAAGLYDDAVRVAGDIASPVARAGVLLELANAASGKGNRARAAELLDDALRVLQKADVGLESDRAQALARIAGVYVPADTIRGFDVVQEAVRSANVASRQVASPEERARAALFKPADLDAGLAPAFEALGGGDYYRALVMAQSIDDRALAILSQLAVARGVIRERAGRPAIRPHSASPTKGSQAPASKPAAGPSATPPTPPAPKPQALPERIQDPAGAGATAAG